MSILKQENKIIRNLSGEILTEPPLIDISSDYGVTKDGSNLVSSVKDSLQPIKYRTIPNYEPIENGNGFELTRSTRGLVGNYFDYSKPHAWEMWFYPKDLSNNHLLMIDNSASYAYRMQMQIFNTSYVYIVTRIDGVSRTNVPFSNRKEIPINQNIHILFTFNGDTSSCYINGYNSSFYTNYGVFTQSKTNVIIGYNNRFGGTSNGNYYRIKVSQEALNNYDNFNGNTLINSDGSVQTFTPPIFPNTIL